MAEPGSSDNSDADPESLLKDATVFAQKAVSCDEKGDASMAIFFYTEAAQALCNAALSGCQIPGITERAKDYIQRAEDLKKIASQKAQPTSHPHMSAQQLDLKRAKFLVKQAFDEDNSNNVKDAIELYTQAVELCIKIKKDATNDSALRENVTKLATQALERAEELKKNLSPNKTARVPLHLTNKPFTADGRVVPPLGFGAFSEDGGDEESRVPQVPVTRGRSLKEDSAKVHVGPSAYSKEEIEVLKTTSDINGRIYVPFLLVDMKEKFAFPVQFSDKDGKLALSPKQKNQFGKWLRPEDFCEDPQMIYAVSCFSIRQGVLISMGPCVTALFTHACIQLWIDSGIRLQFCGLFGCQCSIRKEIHEKVDNKHNLPSEQDGDPVYNPCGKYMVKLNINGVLRKVIIDDYFPVSQYGDLLCSYSNNKNELWVSILEKAYMKVMGGYDFPGSNSNIDLHALTGWIPERISISQSSKDDRFEKDKEFMRIFDRFHKGHCLITMATGDIPEAEADRAGLVPTHAYAMLDIREIKGKRLFMLKNPWSHLRWKGRFSEKDSESWTPELQKVLNYDPKNAQSYDNGVFWIDYDSLIHFYDVIYINWNPELFKYTTCLHSSWLSKEGPKKDRYNISDNPQFRLELKSSQPSAVWCLLTRHITDKADFADNKEFIALLVYDTGGKKIYYPNEPPPCKDGVRINSPHYLCKLVENKKNATYTLVVSQYEKNNTIHYTLRVYATCEFSFTKINDPYQKQYEKRITGQWKGITAGGCGNYPETHANNPIYQVKIDNSATDNYLLLELFGPKEYSVGFEVVAVSTVVAGGMTKTSSGDFRRGYTMLELNRISGGVYNISPCTFQPGEEGYFFLDVNSSVPYTVSQLR